MIIKSYIYQEITKKELYKGLLVDILVGEDMVRGRIKEIKSKSIPKDKMIRVELNNGHTGKVIRIVKQEEVELENFKFFNRFFYEKEIFSIYNTSQRRYQTIKKEDNKQDYLFVFSNRQDAESTINKAREKFIDCKVTRLNMNRTVSSNFKNIDKIDFIIINNSKKLSFDKFKQLETEFLRK